VAVQAISEFALAERLRLVLQHLVDLPIRIHNEPKPKWIARVCVEMASLCDWPLMGWTSASPHTWSTGREFQSLRTAACLEGGVAAGMIQNVAAW